MRPNSHSNGVVFVRWWLQCTIDGAHIRGRLCRVRVFWRRRCGRGAGADTIRDERGDVDEPLRHHRACGFAGWISTCRGAHRRQVAPAAAGQPTTPPRSSSWTRPLQEKLAGRSRGRRRYAGRSPPVESLRTGNGGRRTTSSSWCPPAVQVDTAGGRRSSTTSRIHRIPYSPRDWARQG